jgi:metal-dependent amidase/aminoacylase/carboxypeptidase family protein
LYTIQKVLEKNPGTGTVVILGTPAEEGGGTTPGGKILLANEGALEGVDAGAYLSYL